MWFIPLLNLLHPNKGAQDLKSWCPLWKEMQKQGARYDDIPYQVRIASKLLAV